MSLWIASIRLECVKAQEKKLSPEDAVRYSFSTVGIATLATSLVLMAGFGVLAFSNFAFNSIMGLLSAVTIGIGALAEFFLMPPLMLRPLYGTLREFCSR